MTQRKILGRETVTELLLEVGVWWPGPGLNCHPRALAWGSALHHSGPAASYRFRSRVPPSLIPQGQGLRGCWWRRPLSDYGASCSSAHVTASLRELSSHVAGLDSHSGVLPFAVLATVLPLIQGLQQDSQLSKGSWFLSLSRAADIFPGLPGPSTKEPSV